MQRNYLRGLLICLIPCLLAGLFALQPKKYRLGIDLAGGTILVYEVNLERTKLRKATEKGKDTKDKDAKDKDKDKDTAAPSGLSSDDMNQLAAQIKRRIDPTDIKNVTVRPSGDRRVEIILPTGGASGGKASLSSEDVEEVKRLISQMGVLEFRILANGPDDKDGIAATRQVVEDTAKQKAMWIDYRLPKEQRKEQEGTELQARAMRGLPPPAPDGEFTVDINETKAACKYFWVEMGPEERESMMLLNSDENPSAERVKKKGANTLWLTLAAQRDKAVPSNGDFANCKSLIYSRPCLNAETLQKEEETYARLKDEQRRNVGTGAGKTDEEIEALVNRKKVEYFMLTRWSDKDTLKVGGEITITASLGQDRGSNLAVDFRFNGAGGQQFGTISRRNKPSSTHQRQLAVLLDERIVSAPNLKSEITNSGQITGGGEHGFDRKTAERLVQILRSGALSAELREKPVSENTIGPTLGEDTIRRGTQAVGFAFLAILAFMVVYYRFAGLVACVALFANLLLTMGFMVAVNAAFTLPGLAGLVLTLGMAVDANVLIYERLREERNKGANIATAIRNGYDRAFLTIIDTHLTSIFTAIVLYTFGNDNLKGFAISLSVGLIISLFTSLYMTRLMFDFWLHKRWLTELKMMRLFERPNFNPMKYRWFFFPLTGALTVLGLGIFLVRGDQSLNVDFRGGTVFAGKLKEGQERGLTKTRDGLPGFRELLSEERQKERLKVADDKPNEPAVFWENKPADDAPLNVWRYTITYADGTKAKVTLTEKPLGEDEAKMREDVRKRAGQLPDVSVEQTFLSTDNFEGGKSRLFTVRTTEKQRALVQVALDRLMWDDEKKTSLLDGATMSYATQPIDVPVEKEPKKEVLEKRDVPVFDKEKEGTIVLTFDKPTSRNFVQELLMSEFKDSGSEAGENTFTLTGEGPETDGRVQKMRLNISNNTSLTALRPGAAADPKDRAKQWASLATILANTKKAFDTTPEPIRLEVFDSQLASETRTKALYAIVASWIAILLYLWFRFGNWTFGLASVICLVHDLCFTLGAIAVCHYLHLIPGLSFLGIEDFKIDLAAVAALLTLVGYSVNEIIVNFARIREVRGKNPQLTPQMINDSVNQTLSRTILTSMTVLLVSIVLYAFGGEGVHLFAFVMMIGVLISTYSSIFVASPLLLFLGEGRDTTAVTEEPTPADKEEGAEEEEVVEG